jgi:DNA replication protein DnaC
MNIPLRYRDAKYEDVPENIRQAFESIKETRKGIYLHGDVGCGKTHILYALAGSCESVLHVFARTWNVTELLRELRADFDRPYTEKREVDQQLMDFKGLIFLDDVGAEKMSDWVEEVFYLIVNRKYSDLMPLVITSNLSIAELAERVGDRTASRLVEMCSIFRLPGNDRRMPRHE